MRRGLRAKIQQADTTLTFGVGRYAASQASPELVTRFGVAGVLSAFANLRVNASAVFSCKLLLTSISIPYSLKLCPFSSCLLLAKHGPPPSSSAHVCRFQKPRKIKIPVARLRQHSSNCTETATSASSCLLSPYIHYISASKSTACAFAIYTYESTCAPSLIIQACQ